MELFNLRRKIIFWLFVLSIILEGMAWQAGWFTAWFMPGIFLFVWLLVDFMFLDDTQFLFEPSFK